MKRGRSTGNQTKAQLRRNNAVSAGECLACGIRSDRLGLVGEDERLYCGEVQVQHLLSGGIRRGHDGTISLGDWHHMGTKLPGMSRLQMIDKFGPSFAHGRVPFAAEFGSDDELLDRQNQILGIGN